LNAIHIEDLRFKAIIGILEGERHTPQSVIANATISYDKDCEFVDYAEVATIIKTTIIEGEFALLEDAIKSVAEILFCKYPCIKTLSLKLQKPDILSDCTVGVSRVFNSLA